MGAVLRPGDAEWLAEAFGLDGPARLAGPVDRGEQGQVWRLEVAGEQYAVKEALTPLDDEQARLAAELQQRAEAAGVRAPAARPTRDGTVLVRVGGAAVRLYRWTAMAAPDRRLDPEAVGDCLARLHRAGRPVAGRTHPWYREPVGELRWRELVGLLAARGAPFAERLAALVGDLVAVEAVFVEPTDCVLCHRDLWSDNVRGTPDGGVLVIDWDNCGAASPHQELAMVLLEFGVDDERVLRLHDAYRAAGGRGRIASVGDLTMPAAVVGHLGELGCRQWLEAADEPARTRAAGRVEELLDDPWTLDRLQHLVALVGDRR